MNAIKLLFKAVWSERTNILSVLNTVAILLVAYVLWVHIPFASRDDSSELRAQNESIEKLTKRLDHPLSVTVSNENQTNRFEINKVPFRVDATPSTNEKSVPVPEY